MSAMADRNPLALLAQQDEQLRRALVRAVKQVAGSLEDQELRRLVKELEGVLRRFVNPQESAQHHNHQGETK